MIALIIILNTLLAAWMLYNSYDSKSFKWWELFVMIPPLALITISALLAVIFFSPIEVPEDDNVY